MNPNPQRDGSSSPSSIESSQANSEIKLKVIKHGACGTSKQLSPLDPPTKANAGVSSVSKSSSPSTTSPTLNNNDPPQPNNPPSQSLNNFSSSSHIEDVTQAYQASTESHWSSGITTQNHVNTRHNSRPQGLQRRFILNVQQHYSSLINWTLMLLFAIFLCYYFYEVLVAVDPQVGKLNPTTAKTNFIVAVLAQVFGGLMISVYLEILNLLQLQRLSRPRGSLMLEAEQLASSTGALGTARMLFTPGRHHVWTVLRITLPILLIVLGTVQKIGAGVIYEITPYNGTIPVWGGLTAMDSAVLDFIPTSTMAVYFLSWTPNLLSVPQFIWKLPPTNQCADDCVTYTQPGGVNIPRIRGENSSQTLLETGHFQAADAIQIYNAPAIVTEFDNPPNDLIFETDECEIFTPISNDAIKICIKPADFGTAVIGWTICPSATYFNLSCMSNLSWTDEIGQATIVATYTEFTTTSYYAQNLSIINVTPTSAREALPINIDAFKSTWAKLFNPGNDTSPVANPFMVNAFQFELGFYLRLENDDFPNDQQSPLQILRNFITVPLQFSTTALLYMNATIGGFDIPDAMQSTASAALGRWRWKAQLWTVATWIGVAGTLLLSSGTMILWILFQDLVEAKSTAFPSIDKVSLAGFGCTFSDSKITLADLARTQKLADKNTCGIIQCFQKRRGYLIRARCDTHLSTHAVFVVGEEEV